MQKKTKGSFICIGMFNLSVIVATLYPNQLVQQIFAVIAVLSIISGVIITFGIKEKSKQQSDAEVNQK